MSVLIFTTLGCVLHPVATHVATRVSLSANLFGPKAASAVAVFSRCAGRTGACASTPLDAAAPLMGSVPWPRGLGNGLMEGNMLCFVLHVINYWS